MLHYAATRRYKDVITLMLLFTDADVCYVIAYAADAFAVSSRDDRHAFDDFLLICVKMQRESFALRVQHAIFRHAAR